MNAPLLAVDAGGTSTRAVVLALDGTCLGLGTGAGGNPTSSGPDAALAAVADAAGGAARRAGIALADVGSATVAMAGAHALPGLEALAAALGVASACVTVVGDVAATYFSGALEPTGYVVVAGTGSCAAQVRDGSLVRVVGGTGWLLGDGGSGFALGRAVVRAVVAHLDGTGPATALTAMLLADVGVARDATPSEHGRPAELGELVRALYARRPVALARHAPLAFAAVQPAGPASAAARPAGPPPSTGDAVAAGIVARAQDELAALVAAVRADGRPGPLVLGGGVVHGALMAPGAVRSRSLEAALEDADVRVVRDGTVGAGVMALTARGRRPDAAAFERLRTGVEASLTAR